MEMGGRKGINNHLPEIHHEEITTDKRSNFNTTRVN